eukprot:COSAG02_NODE_297_length_25355_cov_78.632998_3_plen_131_part_00
MARSSRRTRTSSYAPNQKQYHDEAEKFGEESRRGGGVAEGEESRGGRGWRKGWATPAATRLRFKNGVAWRDSVRARRQLASQVVGLRLSRERLAALAAGSSGLRGGRPHCDLVLLAGALGGGEPGARGRA